MAREAMLAGSFIMSRGKENLYPDLGTARTASGGVSLKANLSSLYAHERLHFRNIKRKTNLQS